jgi:cobalt-zinc-cadmium efflux system membrane fusion protein
MTKYRYFGILRVVVFAAAATVIATMLACSGNSLNGASSARTNASDPPSDKPQLFMVPQDQMSHIQLLTVAPTTLTRRLRLTGTVAFNAFTTTPVITQVSGPVSRIVATPGQYVRRGEPLLYVASPDYSQLLANYLKARDAYQLAEKNYVRAEDLYEHHAIAQRDLETAESARNQANADLVAAEEALKILGISKPNAINKMATAEIPVLAPIGGEVVERLVAPGQVIQAGSTQAFTISNTSSMWVMANVYPKDLPDVHVGDPVVITTDSYPGTEFHGKISYLAAALDPNTRTLQARIDVRNPHDELKKDMYVTATVRAGTIPNALTVPAAAVLRDAENQPFVYVVNQNNEFARRPVTIGETYSGNTQLTSGVVAGDRIVGDGSLFLQFADSLQK